MSTVTNNLNLFLVHYVSQIINAFMSMMLPVDTLYLVVDDCV